MIGSYEELLDVDVWQLLEKLDAVRALGMDSQQLFDYERIARYTLAHLAERGDAANEPYFDTENAQHSAAPSYTADHFPREWFMDYKPAHPKFGVGDILFMLDRNAGDTPTIREIVVTCVIVDIFEVSYLVAPHNLDDPMCTAEFLEVQEDALALRKETLDPRRKRMELVKP